MNAFLDKSISLPLTNGPRSFTVTTTDFLLEGLVTFNLVPNGNFLCAAVSLLCRYFSPLAVGRPSNLSA